MDSEIRKNLVKKSRRYVPQLDESLTAYCPYEGYQLINSPTVKKYQDKILNTPIKIKCDGIFLVPCSQIKPYFKSKSHISFFQNTNIIDKTGIITLDNLKFMMVVISEPFGAVPYSDVLEEKYPITNYDCPAFFEGNSQCFWKKLPPTKVKKYWKEGMTLIGQEIGQWLTKNFRKSESDPKPRIPVMSFEKTRAHRFIIDITRKQANIEIINILDLISIEDRTQELWETGNSTTKFVPFEELTYDYFYHKISQPKTKTKPTTIQKNLEELKKAYQNPQTFKDYKWKKAQNSAKLAMALSPYNTPLLRKKIFQIMKL